MSRGKRENESKAGPEWKTHDVWAGADPDDWEFYPLGPIPQTVKPDESTHAATEAFFTQPRRSKSAGG